MDYCENCAKLEARIRELEEAGRRASESAQESEDAMSRTIARQNRELETAALRERDARDEGYLREDRLKQLERARELGDLITEDRIIAQLKRGW